VSRDEELVVGTPIGCGATRLVSVLRLTAHQIGPWVSAEAELVGALVVPPVGPGTFVASDAAPPDAPSWSAWLLARPRLLEQLRARLGT